MKPLHSIAACLLLTGSVFAGGTIDSTEYVPVGFFNIWEMIDADDLVTGVTQFISVEKTVVVDGLPRYNVRTKLFDQFAGVNVDTIYQIGIDGSNAFLYGARVASGEADFGSDSVSVSTMFFTPPVLLGNATTMLDGLPVTTNITADIKFKVKIGPKTISGKVDVNGSVTTSWQSVGDIPTPMGIVLGSDLAQLTIDFDFMYSSADPDINDAVEDEETHKTVRSVMGANLGFVRIDGAGDSSRVLKRAILPSTLVGNFPMVPVDLMDLLVDTPGLYNLFYGGSEEGGDPTDGFITLSNVKFDQNLSGDILMTADVDVNSVDGSEGAITVPVIFKGKTKFKKDGSSLVSLKGKTAHPELLSKLNMQAKATLTTASTEIVLSYKAGKDASGLPISGDIMIPIVTEPVANVQLTINKPVDVKFDPNEFKRKLGGEGTLTVGSKVTPVIIFESLKVKEGFPSKRSYSMVETGGKKKLLKFAASNSDSTDYVISKLKAKLIGLKVSPDVTTLDVTLDDQ